MDLAELPDDPDELKRIILDQQLEIDLTRSVVEISKKDPGVDRMALSNREKAILVDALLGMRTHSLGYLLRSLRLARATLYYRRKRMGKDPEAELRARAIDVCGANPSFGCRRVKASLAADPQGPICVSEKRVRRIMRDERIQPPVAARDRAIAPILPGRTLPISPMRPCETMAFMTSPPPLRVRYGSQTSPSSACPDDERVHLSAILDRFDGALAGWGISTSERSEDLTDSSLEVACAALGEDEHPIAHADRGGHYHAESWKSICSRYGIVRSISRKGHSPDNARMEGFFGRLKMELFDTRD